MILNIKKLTCSTKTPSWTSLLPESMLKISAVLMFALLGACSGDDNDDESIASTKTFFQIINGIPDSPSVLVTFIEVGVSDDEDDDIEDSANLAQQDATSLRTIDPGVVTIAVTDVDPDTGDTTVLIPDTMLDLSVGTVYTVVLTGTYEVPELVVFEKPFGDVEDSTDEAELDAIYLGSQGGIELIVAANDTSGVSSLLNLSAQMSSEPFRAATDISHEINLQEVSGEAPVFSVDSVSFGTGTRASLVVTDKLATNPPTVDLFVVFESGIVQTFTNLAQKPKLRFVNAVSDGDVDIEVRDSFSGDLISLRSLAFQQATDYEESVDGSTFQDIIVRRSEAPEETPFVTVVSLEGEVFYTLVFGGSFTTGDVASHLTQTIENPLATITRIKFINAARLTEINDLEEEVDVALSLYVLQSGNSLEDSTPILTTDFMSSAATQVSAKESILVVTREGSTQLMADPVPILLQDISTLLITTTESSGGGQPFEVVIESQPRP